MKDTITAAVGGQNIEVTFRDGTTAQILVRALPIRVLLDDWSSKLGDEAALVELYCDKEEGWDDTITIESHVDIIQVGEALNDPTFAAWTERRMAANAKSIARAEAMGIQVKISPVSSSTAPPA